MNKEQNTAQYLKPSSEIVRGNNFKVMWEHEYFRVNDLEEILSDNQF